MLIPRYEKSPNLVAIDLKLKKLSTGKQNYVETPPPSTNRVKLKEIHFVENYSPEDTLPEDGLYDYLLQPGEEYDDQCK